MLIDWAICMALWDHHYFSVQEENAHLKDGKFHPMRSIIHLRYKNNGGGGSSSEFNYVAIPASLFVCLFQEMLNLL